ncbi:MAG: DUF4278 domain-containing protein [Hydrococcus sp. Prado102]|jgi:hypothetical protein|nr:DUF4278 domain-containing protein [Hydrococcus sp. Prado102]
MKLIFRGAKYEYEPVMSEVVDDGIQGTYRGAPSTIHYHQQQSRRQKYSQELIYRGVHYRNV